MLVIFFLFSSSIQFICDPKFDETIANNFKMMQPEQNIQSNSKAIEYLVEFQALFRYCLAPAAIRSTHTHTQIREKDEKKWTLDVRKNVENRQKKNLAGIRKAVLWNLKHGLMHRGCTRYNVMPYFCYNILFSSFVVGPSILHPLLILLSQCDCIGSIVAIALYVPILYSTSLIRYDLLYVCFKYPKTYKICSSWNFLEIWQFLCACACVQTEKKTHVKIMRRRRRHRWIVWKGNGSSG